MSPQLTESKADVVYTKSGVERCADLQVPLVSLEPAKIQDSIKFGDDFELDCAAGQLRRSGRIVKVERIPMEVLLFPVAATGTAGDP